MSWLESLSNAIKTSLDSKLNKNDANKIFAKKTDLFSKDYLDLKNTPKISKVGLSGSFDDLKNIPDNTVVIDPLERMTIIDQNGKKLDISTHVNSYDDEDLFYAYETYNDRDIYKHRFYMISTYENDGLYALELETNIDELMPDSYSPYMYIAYDEDLYSDIIILVTATNLIYCILTEDIEVSDDSYRIKINFHEGSWTYPFSYTPSSIACSYVDGVRTFIAVIQNTYDYSKSESASLAYISNDLLEWEPIDLYVKTIINSSRYGYNQHIGYKRIISPAYNDLSDGIKFVALANENLDPDKYLAFSYDGIVWEYKSALEITERSLVGTYDFIQMTGGSLYLYSYRAEKIYITDDLTTWKSFDTGYVYGSVYNIIKTSDYSLGKRHDIVGLYTYYNIFVFVDGVLSLKIDTSNQHNCKDIMCASCYANAVDYIAFDQETYNVCLISAGYCLVDSSIEHGNITDKVAKYIKPYLGIPEAVTDDHINSLIDEKLEALGTIEGGDY